MLEPSNGIAYFLLVNFPQPFTLKKVLSSYFSKQKWCKVFPSATINALTWLPRSRQVSLPARTFLKFENSILKRDINVTYITSKTTLKLFTLFVHERQLTLFTPGYFCLIMPRRHTVDSKFWKFWKKRMTSWIHLLIAVAYTKTNLLNY